MRNVDVVVVGAGAAGIAAARRLHGSSLSVLVIEAQARIGGRAWTQALSGSALDMGCGWLHSADENDWAALAPALGCTIDRTPPPWTRLSNALHFPLPDLKDFRAALDRFYERLDVAAEQAADQPASALLEPGNRWNPLISAMSTWINGVELPEVSAHDWGRYHDSGVNWRVSEGYGTLVGRAADGIEIAMETPATRIDHSGPRLRIETARGTIGARAVVVAVPTPLLASEALRFFPELPAKVEAAQRLPLGVDDKLFLGVSEADTLPAESRVFGAIDQTATGSYHLRPFGRPVIEGYFGGVLARDLEHAGEAAFFDFAAEQLAGHFGHSFRKRLHFIAVSSWARDPWAQGAYSYARVGHAKEREVLAASVEGRIFFAGEACSTHDFSTAHGAYRSGVAAAEAVIEVLPPA